MPTAKRFTTRLLRCLAGGIAQMWSYSSAPFQKDEMSDVRSTREQNTFHLLPHPLLGFPDLAKHPTELRNNEPLHFQSVFHLQPPNPLLEL